MLKKKVLLLCMMVLLSLPSAMAWADNSRFMGKFQVTMKVGDGPTQNFMVEIGSNRASSFNDYYVYIPQTGTCDTFRQTDPARTPHVATIMIIGNTVHKYDIQGSLEQGGESGFDRPNESEGMYISFQYSSDFNSVTIKGFQCDSDADDTSGEIQGSAVRVN